MKALKLDFSVADDCDATKIAQRISDFLSGNVAQAPSITVILHEIRGRRNPIKTGWVSEGVLAEKGNPQLLHALAKRVADDIVKDGVNGQVGFVCSGATVGFQGQLFKP
jgi:hypothetical protein